MSEERTEILHEFRNLVKSAGWVRLAEVAKEQIKVREAMILANDMTDDAEVNEVRRLKYERAGMKVLLALPETIIEQYEAEVENEPDQD